MNKLQNKITKTSKVRIYNNIQKYIYEIFDDLFFIQKRYGKWGKIIDVYKIRTMYKNAESNFPVEEIMNGNKPINDARIIPSRKWMRKYGIDELPQIINIIKGDMNFIWSRPIDIHYKNNLDDYYFDIRKKQKPGVFWSYTFFDKKWTRSLQQNANIYAKLLNKYKNEWWTKLYKFYIRTLFKNVKAILQWANR